MPLPGLRPTFQVKARLVPADEHAPRNAVKALRSANDGSVLARVTDPFVMRSVRRMARIYDPGFQPTPIRSGSSAASEGTGTPNVERINPGSEREPNQINHVCQQVSLTNH